MVAAGFAALATLSTVGGAVAAADSTGQGQVGAVLDADGTQGEWRQGSQGTVDADGTQGQFRSSTQGIQDRDGYQGAYAYGSPYASPQYRH